MNKTYKILLGILLLIIIFGLSAFGTYKYNEYKESKVFNSLASEGKQYMIEKDYDRAIQSFKKALNCKNDPDIQNNLALAQSLKDENAKKQEISKDIQLANDAAKNNKYDDASKYLDEVLKIDPNNSEAKNLKDAFAKTVQNQQTNTESQLQAKKTQAQTTSSSTDIESQIEESLKNNGEITYNEAIYLLKKQYPGCSFHSINDAKGKSYINNLLQQNSRMLKRCYFFNGHDDQYDDELQGITAIDKVSTHIYSIIPGFGSDYDINIVK